MPRYTLALRLPKPLQCLHCTLMPAFDCEHLPLAVGNAFDGLFRTMDTIPLVSDGEGTSPDDHVVDVIHRNRELTTAHMQVLGIVYTLDGTLVDAESVGVGYRPFVGRLHRYCFGEGEEADARVIELFHIDPPTRIETLVRRWELAPAFADA